MAGILTLGSRLDADGIAPRLLFYTPSATLVRLCTTNALIALATSWDLYLSGASEDPRMLLPAWISITTVRKPKMLTAIAMVTEIP